MNKEYDLLIIGAGASGLMFLKNLYYPDLNSAFSKQEINYLISTLKTLKFAVLEAKHIIGNKILASGNGRCNILPSFLEEEKFHSSSPAKLNTLLKTIPYQKIKENWLNQGMVFWQEENRLYPKTLQAKTVVDILQNSIIKKVKQDNNTYTYVKARQDINLDIFTSAIVDKIEYKNNIYNIEYTTGDEVICMHANNIVLACGSPAGQASFPCDIYNKFNLKKLDFIQYRPALVPIELKYPIKSLSGQKFKAKLSLLKRMKNNDYVMAIEEGEVLFTDYGLSGIAVMNLSYLIDFAKNETFFIKLDLFSEFKDNELLTILEQQLNFNNNLQGLMNNKLYTYFKEKYFSNLRYDSQSAFQYLKILRNWILELKQVRSFPYAQVSSGGISLSNLKDDFSMRVKNYEKLYIIGESLDVNADCGGNNLYFAWLTAILAANDIHKKILGSTL